MRDPLAIEPILQLLHAALAEQRDLSEKCLQNPFPNLPPHPVLYLFHASSRTAQVHAQEDDYDEQVEGEHDPVYGLRDEAPSGRVDFLVARDVVGAGDVHGLHVDGVTASGWELSEREEANISVTIFAIKYRVMHLLRIYIFFVFCSGSNVLISAKCRMR